MLSSICLKVCLYMTNLEMYSTPALLMTKNKCCLAYSYLHTCLDHASLLRTYGVHVEYSTIL